MENYGGTPCRLTFKGILNHDDHMVKFLVDAILIKAECHKFYII